MRTPGARSLIFSGRCAIGQQKSLLLSERAVARAKDKRLEKLGLSCFIICLYTPHRARLKGHEDYSDYEALRQPKKEPLHRAAALFADYL
ncbi:MAG TPA: hypothetical protein VF600_01835 [Abditibacteriaceae bacterium]